MDPLRDHPRLLGAALPSLERGAADDDAPVADDREDELVQQPLLHLELVHL